MGVTFSSDVDALCARAQIHQLITRRGRAADAKDPDAILREHAPGSIDTHGIFDGTIEDFVEYLRTHNYQDPRYGLQRHTISNVLINFASTEQAGVESYHLALHRIHLGDLDYDVEIGGRYLDLCERTPDGRWLLRHRVVVYDWSRSNPVRAALSVEES
jgi:hypothetical protein